MNQKKIILKEAQEQKKINLKIKKFEKDNDKKALNSIDINNNKSKINKKKLIIET